MGNQSNQVSKTIEGGLCGLVSVGIKETVRTSGKELLISPALCYPEN